MHKIYVTLAKNIESINWVAFGISMLSISLMIFTKFYLNEKFKRQLRNIPLPIELLVVIVLPST